MYGNGVLIGIAVVITHQARQPIPPDPLPALAACSVAVTGTATLATVEFRIVATTILAAATTALVSGLHIL